MAQSPAQLIGRARELDAIRDALSHLERREPAALEILGEPGIGKTRLLAELADQADRAGCVVLSGSASELEHDVPFWVFVDALDDYLRGLEPRRLASLDDDVHEALADVFPSMGDGANGKSTPADERYRTQRAVRDLLETLAVSKPLVVMLDDLHWADSGSIELLGSLLRRPPSGAVLIATALRPRQTPARLIPALERAERAGAIERIEVQALNENEVRELLGSDIDSVAAAELYDASGGNPFYLEQLARVPRRTGQELLAEDDVAFAGVQVPRAVAAAMAAELALLPEDVRRVLEGAAVAGDPFEPELAAAAADADDTTVFDALDELLARDLVRHTETPRRFRFRHPLVRGAVYDAAPGGWRLGAHGRTAAALAARGAPPTARAHHVERSARHGDTAAVALLQEAANEAKRRAPATAAHLFEAALRLMPSTTPPAERAHLLALVGIAHASAGQFQEAQAAVAEAIELLPADAVGPRVTLTARCASLENLLGRHGDAHARLVRALDSLPAGPSTEATRLTAELANDSFYRGEYREMVDWAERSLAGARALGDATAITIALAVCALATMLAGDIDRAREVRAEGMRLLGEMSDEQIAADLLSRTTDPLVATSLFLEHLDEASALAERAFAIARATGQGQVLPILFWAGLTRVARGHVAQAADVFDLAVEIARSTGHAEGIVWNQIGRSHTAMAQGDYDTALTTAEEAHELVSRGEPSFLSTWAGLALSDVLVATGDLDRATPVLMDAGGGAGLPRFPAVWHGHGCELLAAIHLQQGRADDAAEAVAAARASADRLGLAVPRAVADRAEAMMALAAGDAHAAAALALEATEALESAGARIEAAATRMLTGAALAAAGERDEAIVQLERSAAVFEECGAIPRRDAAERELGKLGRRRHRRTRPGKQDGSAIETLTERELEVAWLVVDRKTNAQIAGELFLSEKTVESHLRHLFQKLGVSSRVDVARAVERAEREGVAAR